MLQNCLEEDVVLGTDLLDFLLKHLRGIVLYLVHIDILHVGFWLYFHQLQRGFLVCETVLGEFVLVLNLCIEVLDDVSFCLLRKLH